MRIRRYLTHLILIGAAAATMGAAPAVMVTPAPPQPTSTDIAPLTGSDPGGSYCGDFCGTSIGYGSSHGVAAVPQLRALQLAGKELCPPVAE